MVPILVLVLAPFLLLDLVPVLVPVLALILVPVLVLVPVPVLGLDLVPVLHGPGPSPGHEQKTANDEIGYPTWTCKECHKMWW